MRASSSPSQFSFSLTSSADTSERVFIEDSLRKKVFSSHKRENNREKEVQGNKADERRNLKTI